MRICFPKYNEFQRQHITRRKNKEICFPIIASKFHLKTVAYPLLCVLALYALAANGIVLYLKRIQRKKRKSHGSLKAFSRFHVISSYVNSLSVSHILCVAVIIPLYITYQLVDFVDTDYKCKLLRCLNLFIPLVTINNLFLIGIERYMAVFHPQKVPSSRTLRLAIICAWILAVLLSILLSTIYNLKRVDIDDDTYTVKCTYDNSSLSTQIIMIVFSVSYYVVPSIVLTVMNIKIARYLRQGTKTVHKLSKRRAYEASPFVILIFCYIIPNLLFFVHHVSNIMDFNFISFGGRISAVMAYANSAISPTVLLIHMKDLRAMLNDLLRRNNAKKELEIIDMQAIPNKAAVISAIDIEERLNAGERNIVVTQNHIEVVI